MKEEKIQMLANAALAAMILALTLVVQSQQKRITKPEQQVENNGKLAARSLSLVYEGTESLVAALGGPQKTNTWWPAKSNMFWTITKEGPKP